jgi:hypothetical protein
VFNEEDDLMTLPGLVFTSSAPGLGVSEKTNTPFSLRHTYILAELAFTGVANAIVNNVHTKNLIIIY